MRRCGLNLEKLILNVSCLFLPFVFHFNGNLLVWWAQRLWNALTITRAELSISSGSSFQQEMRDELQQKTLTSFSEVSGNLNIYIYIPMLHSRVLI